MKSRFLPLIGLLICACADDATQPTVDGFPPVDDGTVRVDIEVRPVSSTMSIIRVMIDARSLEIGAYQGRFQFDPEALELVEATLPEDNYRFVNTNRASEGEIRYAGFTVSAFESPVALELRFRNRREVRLEDVSAELEVVGDVMGVEVARQRILRPAKRIGR
jgi:hypothetical protein